MEARSRLSRDKAALAMGFWSAGSAMREVFVCVLSYAPLDFRTWIVVLILASLLSYVQPRSRGQPA